jgi:hypothetical protein
LAVSAVDASAQSRGGGRAPSGGRASGGTVGRAVPRGGPGVRPPIYPRVGGYGPYRPYYYPYYRPGLSIGFGFYGGYGYYGYGYPYYYGYPYAYPYVYAYPGYGYAYPPPGYNVSAGAVAYGGLKIQGAPRDAQVFIDGYYAGIADDFDGALQHLNLQAGPHKVEIHTQDRPPVQFDVDIQPGQTITYHAEIK